MEAVAGASQRRDALAAARDALTGIGSVLWQIGGADLGPVLSEIDDVIRLGEAARVAVVTEALERGEACSYTGPSADGAANSATDADQPEQAGPADGRDGADLGVVAAGLAGVPWIREWAPSLRAGGAGRLMRLTERLRDPKADQLREAVESGQVGVANAVVCLAEMDRLIPRLRPPAVPTVWTALIDLAARFGPREIRAVRPRLLADYGAEGELQAGQDTAARRVALSQPYDQGDGIFEYALRLDVEGKTVLEAALGPLAAPRPTEGIPDRRGSDRRRADALIELVRRAVACPDGVPTAAKAQLFLTVDVNDLIARVGAATTIGSADSGTLLAPETVRRIGCDAGILPAVMGGPGHVLDLGHGTRWFTPAQTKALWLRDRHCTIPGCGMPAQWCDGHHIHHYADGGPTDLSNATLLCGYHHRWVHDHRLTASIGPDGQVAWDLTPGSYDRHRR
jgi:hypothetical protein